MGVFFWLLVGIDAAAAAVILYLGLLLGREGVAMLLLLVPFGGVFWGAIAATRAGYRPLGYFLLLVLAVPSVLASIVLLMLMSGTGHH